MRKKRKRKSGGNPKGKSAPPYPFEFKLKLVRLYLEDNYSVPMLAQEFGVSEYSLYRWSNQYRKNGEAGLVLKGRSVSFPVKRTGCDLLVKIIVYRIKTPFRNHLRQI